MSTVAEDRGAMRLLAEHVRLHTISAADWDSGWLRLEAIQDYAERALGGENARERARRAVERAAAEGLLARNRNLYRGQA